RVMREPLLILGAGRALLMQAANPLVAQGALDHSGFDRDPYGRLERTIEWVTLVSFGTTAEAGRASAQVNALHRRVVGRLPVAAAMRAYVTRQVERGPALPGAGSRLVGDTVLHPPVRSALMRPGMELLGFIAAGLLPDRVREGYAIPWTGAHGAAHRTIRVTLRTLGPALPRRLRISPIHDLAV